MTARGDVWVEALSDRSGRQLLRYLASRLKDGTDADDLAQEAYLRLLRVDDGLLIHDPRSFALRVATNIAYEWGRLSRHRREHVDADCLQARETDNCGPLEQAVQAQQVRSLQRALERLSPQRRAVVLLHIRDGLSYAQIGAHAGISVSLVGKHLSRGLAACREALKK